MIEVKDGNNRQPGETGFFSGITNDDYHAAEGVSSSKLGCLIDCPSKYHNIMKQTNATSIGQAFHSYLLEPDVFKKEYGILEEPNGVTKAAKEEKKFYTEKGMLTIKRKDFNIINKMKESVMCDSALKKLFDESLESYVEHSGFWEYTEDGWENGILCKFRPDYLVKVGGSIIIVDIKTINSSEPKNIESSIAKRSYHRQAAFYIDGAKKTFNVDSVAFINAFIEKPDPNEDVSENNIVECLPVAIPEYDLDQGRREYITALRNKRRFEGFIDPPGYKEMIALELGKNADEMPFVELGLPYFKQDDQNRLERSE